MPAAVWRRHRGLVWGFPYGENAGVSYFNSYMVFTSAYRAQYATGSAVVPCDPPLQAHAALGQA